ncbi:MAG TPA: pitrilysin family protein [Polyangia bacterium]|jgi:zinc protease|nr:pitrilysin family protein [Polyangia bacterium]
MSGALVAGLVRFILGATVMTETPSAQPAPPPLVAPPATRASGPAGSLLIVETNRSVPLVHIMVAARTGSATDPRHRDGLTNLATEMARRGAGKRSREEIDGALDALGANLDVHAEPDSVRFEGEVLSRNLDAFLDILGDIIIRPQFSKTELGRTRRELIAHLEENRTDDRALCARFFARNLYGEHPYGHPPEGTRAALEAMTTDELSQHFKKHFVGKNLIFAASGDIEVSELQTRLGRAFAGLREGPAPKRGELREPVRPQGWRIQLVDKPDRQQAQLMFGHAAVSASDPDFVPLSVAMAAFGGHGMSSTLMTEVRTKRGLAYGAYMSLGQRRGRGPAAGYVFSANDKIVPTLKLVLRLYLGLMDKGIPAKRVEFFKEFLAGSYVSEIDPPAARLDHRVQAEVLGLPADHVETTPARLRAVTPEEVAAAITKHVRARDLAITIVASAPVVKRLLLEAKVQESAIDVVGFESY